MEISEFAFRLLLLFLPGLITFVVLDKLTNHKKYEPYEVFLYTLLLGFIDYLVFYAAARLIPCLYPYQDLSFLHQLNNAHAKLSFRELFLTTVISIPVSILLVIVANRKWLFRFANRMGISSKFSGVDVWDYVFNSDEDGIEWVVVRDVSKDLMYKGWVVAFSDSAENKEVFLREVEVFKNSTGDKLYEVPGVYLNGPDMIIEFIGISMEGE